MLTLILNVSLNALSDFIYISNNCNDNGNDSPYKNRTRKCSFFVFVAHNFTLKPPWERYNRRLIEQSHLTRDLLLHSLFFPLLKWHFLKCSMHPFYLYGCGCCNIVVCRWPFHVPCNNRLRAIISNLLPNDRIQSYWRWFFLWLPL